MRRIFHLDAILLSIVKGGLYFLPFLSLVLIPPLPFPFITGRTFLFRIIVEIMFVAWLGLLSLMPEYRPKLTRLTKALLLFLVILAVADFFGANPSRSFWSTYNRMEGFLTILHVGLAVLIIQSMFRTERQWWRFFHFSLIASLAVSAIFLLQTLNVLPSLIENASTNSTLGNTSFVSAYLLFNIFFSLFFLVRAERLRLRILYGTAILFEVLVIFLASTRGVLLAIFLASLFLLGFAAFSRSFAPSSRILRRMAVIGLIAALALPLLFWMASDTHIVRSYRFLTHLTESDSMDIRLRIWKMAWRGIVAQPLLGWGQENYYHVYDRYYNPEMTRFDEVWEDRAHNVVLDWLLNAGILGLTAYLSFFYVAYKNIAEKVRTGVFRLREGVVLGTAFIAYAIQNLFIFDTLLTYLLFFALLSYTDFSARAVPQGGHPGREKRYAYGYGITAFIFLIIFIASFSTLHLRPIRAGYDSYIAVKKRNGRVPPIQVVQSTFAHALSLQSFGEREIREVVLIVATDGYLARSDLNRDDVVRFVNFAIAEGEKEIAKPNSGLKSFIFLEILYRAAGARLDPSYLDRAEAVLFKALQVAPANQRIYLELAKTYIQKSEYFKAIEVANKAVASAPDVARSYVYLARAAVFAGQKEVEKDALEHYYRALELDRTPPDITPIVSAYFLWKRFDAAADFYRHMIDKRPGRTDYYLGLLASYHKAGDSKRARETANTIIRLAPELQSDVQNILASPATSTPM